MCTGLVPPIFLATCEHRYGIPALRWIASLGLMCVSERAAP